MLLGIKSDELSSFTNQLGVEISKIQPSVMLHPNIHNAYETNKNKAYEQEAVEVVSSYEDEVKTNHARQMVVTVEGETFLNNPKLHQEVFGPFSMVVQCKDAVQLEEIIASLGGQLTGTIIAGDSELEKYSKVVNALQNRVGRIIFNGVPTGVEVCPSMVHGGPYPASTDSRYTAVGVNSIKRWVRPFSYQNWPNELLPDELKDENPLQIQRTINGKLQ